ncbi:ubiquitin thiolesterase [Exophiala dermatitidis NIH/UT8656]|uniref:ubiquitinyl hydrolase 1 n=1 Tax=Exophiala dermatitidis (strain ATCC 34100 / CBS 525.76 / NIH/UT8656) TaxID=858893 RepID=H6C767_EXODN|nr:ubiquitin thiolesterase [Exophiala dermatitidis NIH/UT8656]EHY59563.1 ubiquitin thiolesterase [Exophiala dermatitidis NIH/UT8656]
MAGVQGNIRSFIAPIKGAGAYTPGIGDSWKRMCDSNCSATGRTAPALLEDLTLCEPWQIQPDAPNLLADSPLRLSQARYLGDLVSLQSCRHNFALKPRQSRPPVLDERPGPETIWTVAAFCQVCRLHVHVKVDYTIRFEDAPCPNEHHPLHHLVRSEFQEPLERNAWRRQYPNSQDEIYTYKCSSKTCSATVTVRLSPPVLRPSDVLTLVDPDLLRQRTEDAFRTRGGSTEGMKYPVPVDVLSDLRAYLKNSWKAKEDPKYRAINIANRRFAVRFGPDGNACKDVLERLGFRLVPGDSWRVPEPDLDDSQPLQSAINIWLDNAEHELVTLIFSQPDEDRSQLQDTAPPESAELELSRLLGCQDCEWTTFNQRTPFTALGCPMDLSDQLVAKAYHWQVETDSHNGPIYLTHLQHIAQHRTSELLETEVVLETSKGRFDAETLDKAYKAFHFTGPDWDGKVTDNDIIGAFTAMMADSPSHEHELREYLRIIGTHRNSKTIVDIAQNVLETYEQALAFLDADPTTEDEHIQALFTVKTNDNKSLEDQAIKAISLIAQHRQSRLLSSWIESGFTNQEAMDPAEGYQALQISNREIDDEMIMLQYNMAIEENPGSIDFYNKALAAIANGRGSSVLLDHLQRRAPQVPEGTLEEPVGLENIGNTCYLNSLLQFLFTMIQLRHIVLNFDDYKMPLDEKSMEHKRVGQRKVSVKEVQTAQKFVASLASLFRGMIETPQSSIRPDQELARLTLETESVKEKMRRRSTLKSSDRPSLGDLDSRYTLGPLTLAEYEKNDFGSGAIVQTPFQTDDLSDPIGNVDLSNENQANVEETGQDETADIAMDDNSSEATLVSRADSNNVMSDAAIVPTKLSISDDKENQAPEAKATTSSQGASSTSEPLAPASPSRLNVQAGANATAPDSDQGVAKAEPVKYQPPPDKPPPVPPRRPMQTSTSTLEEYARQQDVTEVMNHCIIQLSCAMRPTGSDKSGEQEDEVHDLFFGKAIIHSRPEKESPQPVSFLNIITRVYHQPQDVYAAIDNEYDLQDAQDGTQSYTSIARLPPVLNIALDRVAWNQQAKRQEKLNHHVEVPETVYMDRYLESANDSELLQRRQQTWEIKKELAALCARRDVLEEKHVSKPPSSTHSQQLMQDLQGQSKDLPGLLKDAKLTLEYLAELFKDPVSEDVDVNPDTVAKLGILAENARSELEGTSGPASLSPISLSQQVKEAFVDMRKHPYRLHAAFFHRGGAGGGHYWVYIYDHKKEVWRKYNDDRVTVVENRNEIFGKPTQDNWGPPPNPYLLVYIQADRIDELAETVKRDIVFPAPDQPPPVPARNLTQMSALPPSAQEGRGDGDVEMVENVDSSNNNDNWDNGGEQAQNPIPSSQQQASEEGLDSQLSNQPTAKKGDWDDSQLITDRPINW